MTTLVLQTAGSALGGAVGGFAGPIGAAAGRVLGAAAGRALDAALFGDAGPRHVEGPRLAEMEGLASTEGAPVPRLYGRARVGGQLIWATRFEEVAATTAERSRTGAKSSGGRTSTTRYTYYANLAVGLCEGPVSFIRRVWADGRELDLTTLALRLHRGADTQEPDPLIVAKEGAENAPAYRGLAYAVFERLDLSPFGNRVPQFSFEVVRAVDGLGAMIRALCLIPGATEHGYDTVPVIAKLGLGRTLPENCHQLQRDTDVAASLDALQALCPNLERVSLVASWFGDDLRAGSCTVAPRVERGAKTTAGGEWRVGSLSRGEARAVSLSGGVPAYGGTPSDAGLARLVRELKARGIGVVLYPFVMMDVPAGNALPDPRTGAAPQPPYPWRGRITCDPAPGRPGSPDGTPAAAAQIDAFFGKAAPGDFAVIEGAIAYSGPAEWSFRRHVLHLAHLAGLAGGVEGFILGSELVGLTRVRSGPGLYPAVEHLVRLAADLRTVLAPGTRLAYAADWTEYGAHVREGGAEVRFPLDPLWASPALDAVGIDYYPPISDWRDGTDHRDLAEARSAHDLGYLRARLGSGEAFDWYYAGEADRLAQARTPITDGAYGKPWVYRAKDLAGWWANPHVERVGGAETGATAWLPRGKPIWLTEIGVPAVDKGPNGPNVFPDPKSSESAHPPLSHGTRDDLVQARALEAILTRFDARLPGHPAGANPASPVYGGPMVDPARIFVWAWDARPYPAFPDFSLVWADGANWETGHWLNGRLEGVPLDRLVAAILADYGVGPGERPPLDGFVDGYVIDRPLSAREALEGLCRLFGVDAVASGGALRFAGRGGRPVAEIAAGDLAEAGEAPGLRLVRAQEGELPGQVEIGFTDGEGEYRRAAAVSRRIAAGRQAGLDVAVVTRRAEAQRLADIWLQDLWAARETAAFRLSPRRVELEPGDIVRLATPGGARLHRVTRILDGPTRAVETRAVEPAVFAAPLAAVPRPPRRPPPVAGPPEVAILDLPAADGEPATLQHIAVAAEPWPGIMAVWRAAEGAGFALHRTVERPALIGRLLTPLPPGPLWRWDRAAGLDVLLSGEGLAAIDDEAALAGGNLFGIQGPDGRWEIVSAARADLVGERTYRLGCFLRGLAGSEAAAGRTVPAGALLVRLDASVVPLAGRLDELGRPWRYRIGPAERGPADPAAVEVRTAAGPEALRPFAPVHVTARRGPDGIALAWIRRTRRDGDPWEPAEVPLHEEAEAYQLDILRGGEVARTLAATAPGLTYAAADELADFGSAQERLRLRLVQMSAQVGRGFAADLTLPVI